MQSGHLEIFVNPEPNLIKNSVGADKALFLLTKDIRRTTKPVFLHGRDLRFSHGELKLLKGFWWTRSMETTDSREFIYFLPLRQRSHKHIQVKM